MRRLGTANVIRAPTVLALRGWHRWVGHLLGPCLISAFGTRADLDRCVRPRLDSEGWVALRLALRVLGPLLPHEFELRLFLLLPRSPFLLNWVTLDRFVTDEVSQSLEVHVYSEMSLHPS